MSQHVGTPSFQFARVIAALVVREMTTKYGRFAGGYFWAVFNPVAAIALMTTLFSLVLRTPQLGHNFALFYATGFMAISVYSEITSDVSGAVRFNRPLLQFPAVTPIDTLIARLILSFLTQVVVCVIVFVGIVLLYDVDVNLKLDLVALAFLMAASIGLGWGALNIVLFAYFPVWERIWIVVNRPLFLISGVFYTYESLPPEFQAALWFNPIAHAGGMFRSGFYGVYDAPWVSPVYVFAMGLGLLIVGLWLLRQNASDVVNAQ
ncbi:MAG: ABC transporter permease [Pseudomonadota bacterium]